MTWLCCRCRPPLDAAAPARIARLMPVLIEFIAYTQQVEEAHELMGQQVSLLEISHRTAHLGSTEQLIISHTDRVSPEFGAKQGMVDADYVSSSGDSTYTPGQRLIIKPAAVLDFVDIIEKLGRELIARTS